MQIGSVSSISDYLATSATQMKSADVQAQVQMAVMKKVMDQQKMEGEALVRMIQNTPGQPGSLVDIRI